MSFSEKLKRFYVRHYRTDHPAFLPFYMAALAFSGWNAGMAVQDAPDAAPTTVSAQQIDTEVKQVKQQLADMMASKEAAEAPKTEIIALKRYVDRGVNVDAAKVKLDALRLDQAKKNMLYEDKLEAPTSKILLSSAMPEARLAAVLRDFNQVKYKVAVPDTISRLENSTTWRDECRLGLGKPDTVGLSNSEKANVMQFCTREANSDEGGTMIAATAGGALAGFLSMGLLFGAGGTSLRRRWYNQQANADHEKYMAERARRDALRAANPPASKPDPKKTNNFNLD